MGSSSSAWPASSAVSRPVQTCARVKCSRSRRSIGGPRGGGGSGGWYRGDDNTGDDDDGNGADDGCGAGEVMERWCAVCFRPVACGRTSVTPSKWYNCSNRPRRISHQMNTTPTERASIAIANTRPVHITPGVNLVDSSQLPVVNRSQFSIRRRQHLLYQGAVSALTYRNSTATDVVH